MVDIKGQGMRQLERSRKREKVRESKEESKRQEIDRDKKK